MRGGRGQNIIYKKSGDSGAKSVKNNVGGGQVDDGVKIVQKGCRWTISVRLKMNRKVTRAQDLNLNKRVSRSGRLFLENWNMGMRRATGNGQRATHAQVFLCYFRNPNGNCSLYVGF